MYLCQTMSGVESNDAIRLLTECSRLRIVGLRTSHRQLREGKHGFSQTLRNRLLKQVDSNGGPIYPEKGTWKKNSAHPGRLSTTSSRPTKISEAGEASVPDSWPVVPRLPQARDGSQR
jgi:hypothetical protein